MYTIAPNAPPLHGKYAGMAVREGAYAREYTCRHAAALKTHALIFSKYGLSGMIIKVIVANINNHFLILFASRSKHKDGKNQGRNSKSLQTEEEGADGRRGLSQERS